jgi:HEAT repeat protein
MVLVFYLVLPSAWVMGAQGNPPTAPPAVPATTPPGSATSSNPSVMLLKQGHTEGVRARAAQELGKQGDVTTIPALAAALSDSSWKVRREVVLALVQFHNPDVLPPLEQATKDLDKSVRLAAIQCLVGYYSGVLPKSGLTGFMSKNWELATSHFQADDTKIDPDVAVDPTVITSLIAAMKDTRSHDASREAAKGLGILLAKAASPDLVTAAHSSDPDLSREALNSLAKIKDKDAGPKLVDLLDSPNKDIKRDACVTAGILRTHEALGKMQLIYQSDSDQKDKTAAMQGLGYLGDKMSVPLFIQALWNDNKDVRQAAGEGLARAADPQCLGELQKAIMAEKDASAKLAMEFALAALGKDDGVTYVVTDLGSKIRGDVARAYLTELARDPAFLPKLYPYLQSPDNGIRKRLCVVLMYSGDAGSLQQLDRLEHDQDNDVAAAAVRAKRAIRARLDAAPPAAKS